MQCDLACSMSLVIPAVQRCNLELEVTDNTMAMNQTGMLQGPNLALGDNKRVCGR
jgi:hypothetical protein